MCLAHYSFLECNLVHAFFFSSLFLPSKNWNTRAKKWVFGIEVWVMLFEYFWYTCEWKSMWKCVLVCLKCSKCCLKWPTKPALKLENFSTGHATNNKRAQTEKDHIKRGPTENLVEWSLPQITNGPQHKYIKLAKIVYMDSPTK